MLDKENIIVTIKEWKKYNKRVAIMMLIFVIILFLTVFSFYAQ